MSELNAIKEYYNAQTMHLKQIKQWITNDFEVDQQTRSKFRIKMESLLIDINEEIFAVREEISRLLQASHLTAAGG